MIQIVKATWPIEGIFLWGLRLSRSRKLLGPIVALCIVCGWDESAAQNNTEPLVQTGAKWEVIGTDYQASASGDATSAR